LLLLRKAFGVLYQKKTRSLSFSTALLHLNRFQYSPDDFRPGPDTLAGKTILVTGAATELGSAVSLAAAESGAALLLLDRKQRMMDSLYDAICSRGLPEPMTIEFDMVRAHSSDYGSLGSSLQAQYHSIQGLVHCAMWGAPLSPIANTNLDTWMKTIDRQLTRPMYMTRILIPLLRNAVQSSVIFSTLDVGRQGRAYWGAVGAAAAAVENLSCTLAAELSGYNIRVNTLDPGNLKTALRRQFYPAESNAHLCSPASPAVVNPYLYLLSDAGNRHSSRQFRARPGDRSSDRLPG